MTIFIGLIDGLDYRYVAERGLLDDLSASELHQDLEGANGLYTYRVWPAIYVGENGGYSENDKSCRWDTDKTHFWECYPSKVVNAIDAPRVFRNQTVFPDNYAETKGPRKRFYDALDMYREEADDALDNPEIDVLVLGSKQPDILGHTESEPEKTDRRIRETCELFEDIATDRRTSFHLLVSDHGFVNDYRGKNSGVDSHTRHATLASDFAEYDTMSSFIEGWHDDLAEAHHELHLESLGYI